MTQISTEQVDLPTSVKDYTFPELSSFPPLKNDLLLRSASNESPLSLPHPPIWVMRQAGRYLPEFLAIRAKHSFFTVCRTPELACELTMQPIRRFDGLLDAAIIFSDILVVPQAMGLEVQMLGGVGPHFPNPLTGPEDAVKRILERETKVFDELNYVFAAITLTRNTLEGRVPLIGFCAGPWTLFGYMVEGGGSKTWEKVKSWIYRDPENAKAVLDKIARVSAEYLVGQVRAGAQVSYLLSCPPDVECYSTNEPCQPDSDADRHFCSNPAPPSVRHQCLYPFRIRLRRIHPSLSRHSPRLSQRTTRCSLTTHSLSPYDRFLKRNEFPLSVSLSDEHRLLIRRTRLVCQSTRWKSLNKRNCCTTGKYGSCYSPCWKTCDQARSEEISVG